MRSQDPSSPPCTPSAFWLLKGSVHTDTYPKHAAVCRPANTPRAWQCGRHRPAESASERRLLFMSMHMPEQAARLGHGPMHFPFSPYGRMGGARCTRTCMCRHAPYTRYRKNDVNACESQTRHRRRLPPSHQRRAGLTPSAPAPSLTLLYGLLDDMRTLCRGQEGDSYYPTAFKATCMCALMQMATANMRSSAIAYGVQPHSSLAPLWWCTARPRWGLRQGGKSIQD